MRMRKLGQGQSVVFCIPQEIQGKIQERMSAEKGHGKSKDIEIRNVLEWAISETHNDARKSMPLWATQGRRFERQRAIWEQTRPHKGRHMTAIQAKRFLEEESQSLEQRYRPMSSSDGASDRGGGPGVTDGYVMVPTIQPPNHLPACLPAYLRNVPMG